MLFRSWSDPVPLDQHGTWIKLFDLMIKIKTDHVPRCIRPEESSPTCEMRLICLSDAGTGAAGTAVYAGTPLADGTFSCKLVLSRSKIVSGVIPRNELEGILLMAETAQSVACALQRFTISTRLYSDSNIAICWVLNGRKRLRAWVFNRVSAILS